MKRRDFINAVAVVAAITGLPPTATAATLQPRNGQSEGFLRLTKELGNAPTYCPTSGKYAYKICVQVTDATKLARLADWMVEKNYLITDEAVSDLHDYRLKEGFNYWVWFDTNHLSHIGEFKALMG